MLVNSVALLRGINVGGKRKIPMKELAPVFVQSGCTNVKTYLQSGNVLFSTNNTPSENLSDVLGTNIEERFGFQVPVVLRTAEQLVQIVRNNPFLKNSPDTETLHVMFLADLPHPDCVNALDPTRSSPDEFIVCGQEIYLRLPGGVAETKLTNQYFDSKLRTIGTMRNWRTVTTLLELIMDKK
ncbi:MAG: DUF1697 domain-containing protein [Leptospirales bacterium]